MLFRSKGPKGRSPPGAGSGPGQMEAQRGPPGEEQPTGPPGRVTVKEENLDQAYLDDGECKFLLLYLV